MKIKPKLIMVSFLHIVAIAACSQTASTNNQTTSPDIPAVKAQKAADFLNSIGVNSSISKRGEQLEKTAEAIKYTGIRWIRTGYEGDIPVADLINLNKQTHVKFSYGLLSGGTDIKRLLDGGRQLAVNNSLLAFEGCNEPNNWGFTYNGQQGGKNETWIPVAELQKNLYESVKKDGALKTFPVWSLSENGAETDNVGLQFITIPMGSGAKMPDGTKYADFANCHNYITHPSWPGLHDNQTWNAALPAADTKVDGLYGNYGLTWNKKFAGYSEQELKTVPRVTTETGLTIDSSITEEQHGRLLINMYLAQFTRGWSYTAVYLLRDRSDERGNQQFGFYKIDYTPRKAAFYLHNLTTILADNKKDSQTGSLKYQIINQPNTVHDLLLQKSDGKFELIVWGEKLKGSDEVEIKLGEYVNKISLFDPTNGTTPMQTLLNGDKLKLVMTNSPFIIEVEKP